MNGTAVGGLRVQSRRCEECGGRIDQAEQACQECGLVAAGANELNLTTDDGRDEGQGIFVFGDNLSGGLVNSAALPTGLRLQPSSLIRKKATTHALAASFASKVGLAVTSSSALRGVVDRQVAHHVSTSSHAGAGKKKKRFSPKATVAAAAAVVSRQTSSPLTLAELAGQVGTSKKSVAAQLATVREADPATPHHSPSAIRFIPRFVEIVTQEMSRKDYRALLCMSQSLGEIAERCWMAEGRQPDALAAACIAFAILAAGKSCNAASAIELVCSALPVKQRLVTFRFRELRTCTTKYCQIVQTNSYPLPAVQITNKNVHCHIRLALQLIRSGVGKDPVRDMFDEAAPPSYLVGSTREVSRRARVNCAVQRLKGDETERDNPVDALDVEIEERLFNGEDSESVIDNITPPHRDETRHRDLDDPNLTSADLTEQELNAVIVS